MKKEEIQQNGALKKERQVLLICNDTEVCKKLENSIRNEFGFEIEIAREREKALKMIEKSPWQYDIAAIYDDLKEKSNGLELLKEIKKNYSEIEVIFIIASREANKNDALHEGAFSCFFLPINYEGIAYSVKFAREQAKSRRERKMLEKLQELSTAINSATELKEIQKLACQAAVEILNADHSGLVLFGKDLSKGRVIAEYPETKDFIGVEIQVKGIPAKEKLVYNQEIINVQDLSTFDQLDEVQKTLINLNIRSLIIVPVILNNKVIASFSVDMIKKNRVFYLDEIEICERLASQIAISIVKARYLKELHVLNQIAIESEATLPADPKIKDSEINEKIKEMLQIVREHTGALLDVKNFYIALYDEENDNYSFVYHKDEKDVIDLIPKEKIRKGMTAYVFRTKEAIRVNTDDIKRLADEREIEIVGALPRIWLGAPLIARDKVLGIMAVQNYENENAYDEHDLEVLETIASQTAIAIDNYRLFEHSRKKLAETEALYETTQEIVKESINTKYVLFKILKMAVELSNADSGQIIFRDESTNEAKVVFTYKIDELKGKRFNPGEGMSSIVFETGKAIYSNDYHNEKFKSPIFNQMEYRNLFKALAEVPLKWKGDVIGILAISSKKSNFFTEESIRLLERFAGPAAIAIAIAREISFRKTLLNNSPNPIVGVDTKGIIKEFNKASEQIFGYPAKEVLNKSVVSLWGSQKEAKRIKCLMRKSESGGVSHAEVFVKSKSGEKVPILFSGSLLYGEEKEEIGSIGHVEDQRIVSLRGRTRRLFNAIKEINRNEELPKLLNVILRSAKELLEADAGYIALKKDGHYEVVESFNIKQGQAVEINIKIDEEVIGQIIKKGFPKTLSKFPPPISDITISDKRKSALVIPLYSDDKMIGAIYLESHINDYFREENEMLQILSAEAALAINRSQLKEESEQLQLLKQIGDEIRKGDFSEYMNIIVDTAKKIVRSELSSIFIFQKSNRTLIRKAWYPKFNGLEEIGEIYPEMIGITGKILACKEGDHIIYNDEKKIIDYAVSYYLEKYKCLPSWTNKKNKHSPIQHFLAVPIVGEKGKVFGGLRVMNKISKEYTEENPVLDTQGFREPEDVELLKTIASLLSQGLSSERKAEKLKLLREITKDISEKEDIKGIGDCVVHSIVERLGYSACIMRLVRGDKLELISYAGFNLDKITNMIVNTTDGFKTVATFVKILPKKKISVLLVVPQ
jgi:PAS domain S-box-containing protein